MKETKKLKKKEFPAMDQIFLHSKPSEEKPENDLIDYMKIDYHKYLEDNVYDAIKISLKKVKKFFEFLSYIQSLFNI